MSYASFADMVAKYQSLAQGKDSDALDYYLASQGYAEMQIVKWAVAGTDSLGDARLSRFTRQRVRDVVGNVRFEKGGGCPKWIGEVQYQNITGADPPEFKDTRTQAVVCPSNLASARSFIPA
jgi:hypothetical protein